MGGSEVLINSRMKLLCRKLAGMWLFYLDFVFQTIPLRIFQRAGAALREVILGGKQLNSFQGKRLAVAFSHED